MSETEPPPAEPEPAWEPAWDPDTGPQPSQSGPRSHRAPPQLSKLLAPLTAVVVVIAVIGLLIWINGRPTGGGSAAGGIAATTPQTPPVVVPPATSLPPATPASSKPKPKPKPKPTPARSSPVAHHRPHHHQPPASATAMATVQVLNNSRIHGLAHAVAPEIAAKGWQIALVGNLQGLIAESTVFYAPGERAAALHLAHEFGSIRRVEPNSFAGLSAPGITLVLTRDWVA